MNEQQVQDIVNYLESIQISQQEALRKTDGDRGGPVESPGERRRCPGEGHHRTAPVDRRHRERSSPRREPGGPGGPGPEDPGVVGPGKSTGDGDSLSDISETTISGLTATAALPLRLLRDRGVDLRSTETPATDGPAPMRDVADHAHLHPAVPWCPRRRSSSCACSPSGLHWPPRTRRTPTADTLSEPGGEGDHRRVWPPPGPRCAPKHADRGQSGPGAGPPRAGESPTTRRPATRHLRDGGGVPST